MTYIGTARGPVDTTDVAAILRASPHDNTVAGATGLLLHDGRRFLRAMAAGFGDGTVGDGTLAAQVDQLTTTLGDRTAQALVRSFARVGSAARAA